MSRVAQAVRVGSRIKSWGLRVVVASSLGPAIYGSAAYSKSVQHGEWIVSTFERGSILSTASCLDTQCAIFARTDIACFRVTGEKHILFVVSAFPESYRESFEQTTNGVATVILMRPKSAEPIGQIKTKILPVAGGDGSTIVELSHVEPPFNVAMSVPHGADLVHDIRELQARRGKGRGIRLWPWSRMTGWRAVHAVMAAGGLVGPHASPKGLRHGFGVAAVSAGIPLNLVQKWLGHAQLTTTAIYADAVGEEEQSIAARMW
jgi:Phage integrase family